MSQTQTLIFGHLRGLFALFFTELRERFSYYGMCSIPVLFMVAAVQGENPGRELDTQTGGAIYGLNTAGAGLLMLVLSPLMKRLFHGVR